MVKDGSSSLSYKYDGKEEKVDTISLVSLMLVILISAISIVIAAALQWSEVKAAVETQAKIKTIAAAVPDAEAQDQTRAKEEAGMVAIIEAKFLEPKPNTDAVFTADLALELNLPKNAPRDEVLSYFERTGKTSTEYVAILNTTPPREVTGSVEIGGEIDGKKLTCRFGEHEANFRSRYDAAKKAVRDESPSEAPAEAPYDKAMEECRRIVDEYASHHGTK